MSIVRIKTWITGEVLTAGDLNSEYDNIINNALSLISPLTGNLDFGANKLLASSPVIEVSPEDARTNTVDTALVIRSTTSGTPAANIGTGIQIEAESADENPSVLGNLNFLFTDVTAGSEDSILDVFLRTAGNAASAKYRLQATGNFLLTLTHALTAARTITFPDVTGTVTTTGDNLGVFAATTSAQLAGVISDETGSGALVFGTSPTIATPTISSTGWTNANHAHDAANTGGFPGGQQSTVRKTTAFTTTSTSFVDVTDLSITMTTKARKVLLIWAGTAGHDTSGENTTMTFDIDGTDAGGTNGLTRINAPAASYLTAACIAYLTDTLTAASHTFKVNAKSSVGTSNANIGGGSTDNIFIAIEVPY